MTACTPTPASDDPLPLMRSQIEALRRYAHTHGRGWKSRLRTEWSDATADLLLYRLRNTHGHAWLDGYCLPPATPDGSPSDQHA